MKLILAQYALVSVLVAVVTQVAAQSVPITKPTAVNPGTVCQGGTITIAADVVDDGRTAVLQPGEQGGKYWVSYYSAATNAAVKEFQSYSELYTGTVTLSPAAGQYTANNKISGPAKLPNDLSPGTYYVRIYIGASAAEKKGNASNSPPFVVVAPATATITIPEMTIDLDSAAAVQIDFGAGTLPNAFEYDDLRGNTRTFNANNANPAHVYPRPASDYVFDDSKLRNFRNVCGPGTITGKTIIHVKAPNREVTSTPPATLKAQVCSGETITFNFTTSNDSRTNDNKFFIKLFRTSDAPSGTIITENTFPDNLVVEQSAETGGYVSGSGSSFTRSASYRIGSSIPEGKYKLLVFANDGFADKSSYSNEFTINAAPASPVVANANPAACQGAPTVQLSASGTDLVWYDNAFKVLTGTPAQPTNVPAGIYTYYVSRVINGCESDKITVKVTINTQASPPGDATKEYCKDETAQPLTASGQNLIWYTSSGVQLSQAPTPQTNSTVAQSYNVSQDGGTGCRSNQSTITINVKGTPAPPGVSNPAAICQFGPSPTLSASGQNLRWYDSNNNLLRAAPTPSLSSTATQTYYVSQVVDNCEGPKAKIEQTVKPASEKPKVAGISYCVGEKAVPVRADGQNLRWYENGTYTGAAPTPATDQPKTIVYQVTQTSNGCESDRASLTVTVGAKPSQPTVQASQSACLNTTPVALTAGGSNLVWKGSGIPDSTTIAPLPPTTATNVFSYTVTQRFGNCVSPASMITYTVRPLPTAPTLVSPQNICVGQPPLILTANGQNLKWYNNSALSGPPLTQVTIPTSQPLSVTWYVTQTDANNCQSTSTPLVVRIGAQATARLVGDGNMFSTDSSAIRIYLGGDGPWTLTFWDGEKSRTFTRTLENPLVVWVSLPKSLSTDIGVSRIQSYSLSSLSNECGAGVLPAPYQLKLNPVTAIDPGIEGGNVSAYPNPMSAFIRVDWLAVPRKAVTVRIVSAMGRVIWQTDRIGTGILQSEYVDTGFWPGGIYVLQLQSTGVSMSERRIIK